METVVWGRRSLPMNHCSRKIWRSPKQHRLLPLPSVTHQDVMGRYKCILFFICMRVSKDMKILRGKKSDVRLHAYNCRAEEQRQARQPSIQTSEKPCLPNCVRMNNAWRMSLKVDSDVHEHIHTHTHLHMHGHTQSLITTENLFRPEQQLLSFGKIRT